MLAFLSVNELATKIIREIDMSIDELKFKEMLFNDQVMHILESMCDVLLQEHENGKLFLFKNGLKFGFIKSEKVYLHNKHARYQELKFDMETDRDKLLVAATHSFWLASGKEIADSNRYL